MVTTARRTVEGTASHSRVPKRVFHGELAIIKPMFRGEREGRHRLVDLDARVDLLREPEAGQEAARPGE